MSGAGRGPRPWRGGAEPSESSPEPPSPSSSRPPPSDTSPSPSEETTPPPHGPAHGRGGAATHPAPPEAGLACDRNLALFEEELATRPRVPALLRRIAPYSALSPDSDDGHAPRRLLGTLRGVAVPSLQTLLGLVLVLRLPWVVGTGGVLQATAIGLLLGACAVLTAVSLSAIATNGLDPGGCPLGLLSGALGPEAGGAVGLCAFLSAAFAAAAAALGAAEILLVYVAPQAAVLPGRGRGARLNNGRGYGAGLLGLLGLGAAAPPAARAAPLGPAGLLLALLGLQAGALRAALPGGPPHALCLPAQPGGRLQPCPTARPHGAGDNGTQGVRPAFPGPSARLLAQNLWPRPPEPGLGEGPGGAEDDDNDSSFGVLLGLSLPTASGVLWGCSRSGELRDIARSVPAGSLGAAVATALGYLSAALLLGASVEGQLLRDKFGGSLRGTPVAGAASWPSPWVPLAGALLSAAGAGLQALLGGSRLLRGLARTRALPLPHVLADVLPGGQPGLRPAGAAAHPRLEPPLPSLPLGAERVGGGSAGPLPQRRPLRPAAPGGRAAPRPQLEAAAAGAAEAGRGAAGEAAPAAGPGRPAAGGEGADGRRLRHPWGPAPGPAPRPRRRAGAAGGAGGGGGAGLRPGAGGAGAGAGAGGAGAGLRPGGPAPQRRPDGLAPRLAPAARPHRCPEIRRAAASGGGRGPGAAGGQGAAGGGGAGGHPGRLVGGGRRAPAHPPAPAAATAPGLAGVPRAAVHGGAVGGQQRAAAAAAGGRRSPEGAARPDPRRRAGEAACRGPLSRVGAGSPPPACRGPPPPDTRVPVPQHDSDVSAYTYERTLMMEQRSQMLRQMRQAQRGPAPSQAPSAGEEEEEEEEGGAPRRGPSPGNVRRMHAAERLNEAVGRCSGGPAGAAGPAPRPPGPRPLDNYLEFLEVLTEGLGPVLLVRGGDGDPPGP
ncbi:uncharacterized protein [Ciconia boyciana]|uniref:uncharacterized protein isoform X7 n=1 Tax=Ciconia boyciana TaxID=52775 RepID=UPI003BA0FC20